MGEKITVEIKFSTSFQGPDGMKTVDEIGQTISKNHPGSKVFVSAYFAVGNPTQYIYFDGDRKAQ